MPGPGFATLSPTQHRAISSKGGKVTVARWRQKLKVYNAVTPLSMQLRGRNGGKMSALSNRITRLEARMRQLEESR